MWSPKPSGLSTQVHYSEKSDFCWSEGAVSQHRWSLNIGGFKVRFNNDLIMLLTSYNIDLLAGVQLYIKSCHQRSASWCSIVH